MASARDHRPYAALAAAALDASDRASNMAYHVVLSTNAARAAAPMAATFSSIMA